MTSRSRDTEDHPATGRPAWSVRAIGSLLLLEGLMLFGVTVHRGLQVDWQKQLVRRTLSPQAVEVLSTSGFLVPVAMLAIIAAVWFALLRGGGWFLAMLVQGLVLASSIALYFDNKPTLVYVLMAYGVFMVLYMNSSGVRSAFDRERPRSEDNRR